MPHVDLYTRLILDEISAGRAGSQRSVAQHLGIALGRANSLMRDLIDRGWVEPRPDAPSARHYVLTAAGRKQLASLTRRHMDETVAVYASTRQRLVDLFAAVSATCHGKRREGDASKRVAFYGAGDVAEIGYAALRQTDLTLVAVVDDERRGKFFEHAIQSSAQLAGSEIAGVSFERLIVMMVNPAPQVGSALRARAVPRDRICWLNAPATARPHPQGADARFHFAPPVTDDPGGTGGPESDPA